jgi:exodeoxyribonuclease VII small subunit
MTTAKVSKNYKQMSQELAVILEWFEDSEMDVDVALEKYAEATKLLNEMENYLKTAQNKIKKIKTS